MKTKHKALVSVGFLLLALTSFSQEQKRKADPTKPAPSRIPGATNLQDAFAKEGKSWTVRLPANCDPADINLKAKELKDVGTELFYQKNRPLEGIEKIEAGIKIDPRMPEAYHTLWMYYGVAKHDLPTTARYLEEGVKHCPKSGLVHFDLGNLYSDMKRPKEAIEQWTTALDLGVELKSSVFLNIGLEYMKMGKNPDAITNLRKALEEDEKHLGARRHLVSAYVKTGDIKTARKEAQRLLELDPLGKQGAWAREALRQLRQFE